MYRKSAAFLLLVLLSLCRIQPAISQTRPSDNLIALLGQSNAVVTVDVKKMLSETAPDIFNNEPAAMEKLKSAMKSIEDETGVNPFQVNKIAFGLNVSKNAPENSILVLQTDSSAATMAENIFQNQIANAKFSMEKNPVYNRLATLKIKMNSQITEISDEDVATLTSKYEALSATANSIQSILDKTKASKNNATVIENLKKALQETKATLAEFDKISRINRKFDDLIERRNKLESNLEKIELTDAQRLQKISAVANDFDKLEKEFAPRFKELDILQETLIADASYIDNFTLSAVEESLEKLSATEPRRTQTLKKELESLSEFQKNRQASLDTIKTGEPSENLNAEQDIVGAIITRPLYINVSRRDETAGGKKMLVIITKTKYKGEKGENYDLDGTTENVVGLVGENTLIYGKGDSIKQILENKNTSQPTMMTNLINRSPNSLMAFAVDLQAVDLSALGNLLGENPTVWQVFGSLTSANKEVSLTATIEKTDIPLKVSPPNPQTDNNLKIPVVENNSAATDILNLLAKTLTGVEGKLTFKFDKRKTATLIEETPKIFGAMMRSDKR